MPGNSLQDRFGSPEDYASSVWLQEVNFYEMYPFTVTPFNVNYDLNRLGFARSRVEFVLNTGYDIETYVNRFYQGKSFGEIRDTVPDPPGYFTVYHFEEVEADRGHYTCWIILVDKREISEAEGRIRINEMLRNTPFEEIWAGTDIEIHYTRMDLAE